MIVKDWMTEAADKIINATDVPTGIGGRYRDGVREWIIAAIAEHCPMKPGVAYMPVPRCETCAHWHRLQSNNTIGDCRGPACVNITGPDFGCVQHKEKS